MELDQGDLCQFTIVVTVFKSPNYLEELKAPCTTSLQGIWVG